MTPEQYIERAKQVVADHYGVPVEGLAKKRGKGTPRGYEEPRRILCYIARIGISPHLNRKWLCRQLELSAPSAVTVNVKRTMKAIANNKLLQHDIQKMIVAIGRK